MSDWLNERLGRSYSEGEDGHVNVTCIPAVNAVAASLPAWSRDEGVRFSPVVSTNDRFKSFPEVLYHIVSLETILLGNNKVEGLDPSHLLKLSHLSTLDLSNNDLLKIPPELGLCTSLRCVSTL